MDKSAKDRTEMEAARLARLDSLSRRGLLRPPGSILVNRANCDKIRATVDIDRFFGINRPVQKEEFLAIEKHIWNAAMNYWKSKDISSEYNLISDNMTLYPVVFEKHTWYHCNLLGQKRDLACPSTVLIFVEVKCKWEPTTGRSYDVVSCIALDEKSSYNCKVCPASMDIMHPLSGGFTCGSKDGQKVFFYTIPGVPCSSDPCNEKAAMFSSIKPSTTMMKSTAATSCALLGLDNCSRLQGKQGIGNDALEPSHDGNLSIVGQLIM